MSEGGIGVIVMAIFDQLLVEHGGDEAAAAAATAAVLNDLLRIEDVRGVDGEVR